MAECQEEEIAEFVEVTNDEAVNAEGEPSNAELREMLIDIQINVATILRENKSIRGEMTDRAVMPSVQNQFLKINQLIVKLAPLSFAPDPLVLRLLCSMLKYPHHHPVQVLVPVLLPLSHDTPQLCSREACNVSELVSMI